MTGSEFNPALLEDPSAMQRHLGFKMVAWEKDYARLELPLEPYLLNRQGLPHGGVHATLLDSAMGFAGCFTGDPQQQQLALTLSLNVHFIAVARGSLLIAEGRRTGGGRTSYFAEGKVKDDLGTTVATGTGVFRYRRRK